MGRRCKTRVYRRFGSGGLQFRTGHESRGLGLFRLHSRCVSDPLFAFLRRIFRREAVRSSAAVRETSFILEIILFSPASQPNIWAPRRRRWPVRSRLEIRFYAAHRLDQ